VHATFQPGNGTGLTDGSSLSAAAAWIHARIVAKRGARVGWGATLAGPQVSDGYLTPGLTAARFVTQGPDVF